MYYTSSMSELGITIICGSRLAREGVARLLSEEEQLTVRSHHGSLEAALPAIVETQPQVVVIDLELVRNSDAIATLRAVRSELAIVVSGVPLSEETIIACAKAGATSYIRLEATGTDWVNAICAAAVGEVADSAVAGVLNRYVRESRKAPGFDDRRVAPEESWRATARIEDSAARVGLTPRERQVLDLVDKGLSTKHIARKLDCSPSTIKAHIHAILTKYNVHRRSEAAALFRKTEPHSSEKAEPPPRKNYAWP
jgi:DNA-binding NarL/FixJ family response regulator